MSNLTLDKLSPQVLTGIDLQQAFISSRFVITAERLQIFRKLDGRELSAAAICKKIGLHGRYGELFLEVLVKLGLLKKRKNLYRLSALAQKYFIKERSIYWTRLFSAECIKYYIAFSVLEEIVTTGKDYRKILGIDHKSDYQRLQNDPEWASDFTYLLYHLHQPNAKALADSLDLSGSHNLLDIGGGSGVVSMALVRANPALKACVYDFELVCQTAKKIIRKERLTSRIKTYAGDMNKHIPKGYDVIMFWDIGKIKKSVMQQAYRNLPSDGMIVMGSGIIASKQRASLNLLTRQFISTLPEESMLRDVLETLRAVGFKALKHRRIATGELLITGRK